MRYVRRLALMLVLCATVAIIAPLNALAAGPVTTPELLVSEGFESAIPVTYSTAGTAGTGYWAKWTHQHYAGLSSLWCDGTNTAAATKAPYQYVDGSQGTATFLLPQAADYYKPVASFYILYPSRGAGDETAFAPEWTSNVQESISWASGLSAVNYPVASWTKLDLDLSTYHTGQTRESLSRRSGKFRFWWKDAIEPDPLGIGVIRVGEGPSIDDLTISAWRFGPVRSITAATTSTSATLKWDRPWRSTDGTSTEERDISFRVYRALKSSPSVWTELTTKPRVAQAGNSFTFVDATVVPGIAYVYAVQTWAPGSSDAVGYGEPVYVDATTERSTVLSVGIASPSSNTSATPYGRQPINVTGSASTDNETVALTSVRTTITAARPPLALRYWNGGSWQSSATSVTASGLESWSTQFSPLTGDDHRFKYTVIATATDAHGAAANSGPVVLYADNVYPRIISARSIGRYGVMLRFNEPVYSVSPGKVSLKALSTPYFSVKGMRLGRGEWTGAGTAVRFTTSRQEAPGGNVSVTTLHKIQDFAGNQAP